MTAVEPCPRTGKTKWPTRQDAEAEMRRMKRQGVRGLRTYRCDMRRGGCGAWHFGHVRQEYRRRRSAIRGR
jgi:hypothetical protein